MPADESDQAPRSPFLPTRPRSPRVRVRPGNVDRLRQARLEVIARYRVEVDGQTILEQFMDEAFEPWLSSKLDP